MAGPYPLPTLAAQVTATGISAPTYADVLASLIAVFQQINGADAYLGNDSQDGQMLGIFAQAITDVNTAAIAVYNQFSPATSQGTGLSSVVKINGIKKLVSTNSTADVTIIGVAGVTINNGIVQDTNGNQWNLPPQVIIPPGGEIIVTATCLLPGAISAPVASIIKIVTPVLDWQSVTNTAAATEGAPVETDAVLRKRQAVSTSLPSTSILGGIIGAVANLVGVTQYKIYENDTGVTDDNTIPPHSIAVVVEGGDAVQIAQTIEIKKTPGTPTYGTTSEIVLDPIGLPVTINFFRPTNVLVDVEIDLTPLAGYLSSTGVAIVASVVNAINAAGINGNNGLLSLTSLIAAAYSSGVGAGTFNITAVKISRDPASPVAADLDIAFNELPSTTTSNVALVVS